MSNGKIGVLISGSGSNLQALIDNFKGAEHGEITLVVSNRRDAFGLQRAADAGIEGIYLPKKNERSRDEYDEALSIALADRGVEWVVCAGFMRILGPKFVQRWRNKIINIHPAILPSFPGKEAIQQAVDAGVRVVGATVHFVDEGTDTGPIIAQSAVEVGHHDTVESLKARVLVTEHQLLPMALRWAIEGRLTVSDGVVRIAGLSATEATIMAPQIVSE